MTVPLLPRRDGPWRGSDVQADVEAKPTGCHFTKVSKAPNGSACAIPRQQPTWPPNGFSFALRMTCRTCGLGCPSAAASLATDHARHDVVLSHDPAQSMTLPLSISSR